MKTLIINDVNHSKCSLRGSDAKKAIWAGWAGKAVQACWRKRPFIEAKFLDLNVLTSFQSFEACLSQVEIKMIKRLNKLTIILTIYNLSRC